MKAINEAQVTADQENDADAVFERRMSAVTGAVDDYHAYLLGYLHRLTGQWQDAENLAQDLWRYVLLHFEEDQIHALPLLRRKAYQLFIDHYRRKSRRGEILADELPEVVAQEQAYAFSAEDESAFRDKFWSEYPGIDLTDLQKEALWLHARYGFTCKEIETRLNAPASTIGDWIMLGRKRLSDWINNEQK